MLAEVLCYVVVSLCCLLLAGGAEQTSRRLDYDLIMHSGESCGMYVSIVRWVFVLKVSEKGSLFDWVCRRLLRMFL